MKTLFALLIAFSLISNISFATTRTAVSNGGNGWSTASNWSPSGVPQSGDVVIIPAGITVSVKGNIYSNTPNLLVTIFGTLKFEPSGKLFLGINSYIQVELGGSIISNGTSSEVIKINGVAKYVGSINGNLSGPTYADAFTGIVPDGFIYGTLPLVISHFTVSQTRSEKIFISWGTSQEQDIEKYYVEKSEDGLRWKIMDSVNALNNLGSFISNYSVTDAFPESINFYRLKISEFSGKISYSEIKSIKAGKTDGIKTFRFYPNPATDRIFFKWNIFVSASPVTILFYNPAGQLVSEKDFSDRTNLNSIYIGDIKPGNYLMKITDGKSQSVPKKIIIK